MINIIKYDLYNGIRKRMIWLLLPIIVFTVGAFEIDGTVRLIQNEGGCMSLGECLAYYFHGSIPAGSELGASRPHIVWLIIQLGCLFFTLEYPTRDLNIFGQQVIVRCGSRVKWWLSKCVWLSLSVLIYYFVGVLVTTVAGTFFEVRMSLEIQQGNMMSILNFCNVGFNQYTGWQSVFILIIMPYLSMLALNLFCLIISLLLNQVFSMMAGLFMLLVVSSRMSPFIVTNFSMLQRCSYFYSEGLDYSIGIVYVLAMIAGCVIIGAMAILYVDLIEPKKNGDA